MSPVFLSIFVWRACYALFQLTEDFNLWPNRIFRIYNMFFKQNIPNYEYFESKLTKTTLTTLIPYCVTAKIDWFLGVQHNILTNVYHFGVHFTQTQMTTTNSDNLKQKFILYTVYEIINGAVTAKRPIGWFNILWLFTFTNTF